MRSDPYGVTLGQILTTVRLTQRAVDRIERKMIGKPPRWELRIKDLVTILLAVAAWYQTGSIRDTLAMLLVATGH